MFFGRKHVETEQSFLHQLTCFLNYHMPLKPELEPVSLLTRIPPNV